MKPLFTAFDTIGFIGSRTQSCLMKTSGLCAPVFTGNLWIEARQKQPMDAFDRGTSQPLR